MTTEHKLPFGSIDDLVLSVFRTGSNYTCNPPVNDTDIDYLVLVRDLDEAGARLDKYHWENCLLDWVEKGDKDPAKIDATGYAVEDQYGYRFGAYRKDLTLVDGDGVMFTRDVNLIVTDDLVLYLRNVGATLVAKELNLLDKRDRIALFRCIKYDEPYTGKLP